MLRVIVRLHVFRLSPVAKGVSWRGGFTLGHQDEADDWRDDCSADGALAASAGSRDHPSTLTEASQM
ncbi:MAG: hypothetical protein ACOX7D_03570 [Alphaproteobacteria bacterium]